MSKDTIINTFFQRIKKAKKEKIEELDLSNGQLNKIPDAVFELKSLKILILRGNRITKLSDSISALSNLKKLYLSENKISELPNSLSSLSDLTELYLGSNQIVSLPKSFHRLKKLTILSLSNNNIIDFSDALLSLINLKKLDLSNNKLSSLPDSITQLENLKELDLSGNQFSNLPDALSSLISLKELDLSNNQIDSLPNSFAHLENLVKLSASDNKLSYLPKSITKLTNLRELYWQNNSLYTIPNSIAELTNLIGLDFNNNNLTELPNYLFGLENLTEIDLSNNQLTGLPESIARLTNLTGLYLNNNQLISLPESIARLTNLTGLYLSNNKLVNLPSSIANLTNLQELYLSDNELNCLPNSIANLYNLIVLSLNNNKLKVFPNCIISLLNLTTLYLRDNQLTNLPFSITDLDNLEGLYLSGNRIKQIPSWLAENKLEIHVENEWEYGCINLYNNPIEEPPKEVVQKGNRFILNYYARIVNQEKGAFYKKDYLYEAKVLILGEPGISKTTLFNKIQNDNCVLPHVDELNKGITINSYYYLLKDNNSEYNHSFKLNVWNFGSPEINYEIYRFFISKRSMYVLVIDNQTAKNSLYNLLNTIELFTGNSPVILLVNQRNDLKFTFDNYMLLSRYCENIKEILFCDFEIEEENNYEQQYLKQIYQLISHVEHQVASLSHVGESLPIQWLDIRKELETNSCNYIGFDDFKQVCRNNGIGNDTEIYTLLSYFHDLGIALHFADDPILRERIILDADWVINAAHYIFNNDQIKSKQGRLTRYDCENLWSDPQYSNACDLLIALMKKFMLIYKIDDKGNFIAPHMLPQNIPHYDWDNTRNFTMQFQYDVFMPQGILWRFIVTMHRYIKNNSLIWKNGVILERNEIQVEVIENLEAHYISIRFSGSNIAEFRAIIIDTLDKISESYPKLKYNKRVPCPCSSCQSSSNPHFFDFHRLEKRKKVKAKATIECPSGSDVPINSLLLGHEFYDVLESDLEENQEEKSLSNNSIKNIKIFLASSSELKEQRNEFETYLRRENDYFLQSGIYLQVVMWENFIDHMSKTRLQDEYNKAVRSCDIFVSLFHSKVGEFTKEEFENAFQTFQVSDKPLIYTYFNQEKVDITANIRSLLDFQYKLKELGHYYTKYQNIGDLKFKFSQQLKQILPDLLKD